MELNKICSWLFLTSLWISGMEAIKDGILAGTKKDHCERLKPYLQHQAALRENYHKLRSKRASPSLKFKSTSNCCSETFEFLQSLLRQRGVAEFPSCKLQTSSNLKNAKLSFDVGVCELLFVCDSNLKDLPRLQSKDDVFLWMSRMAMIFHLESRLSVGSLLKSGPRLITLSLRLWKGLVIETSWRWFSMVVSCYHVLASS